MVWVVGAWVKLIKLEICLIEVVVGYHGLKMENYTSVVAGNEF